MDVTIRNEEAGDIEQVRDVLRLAFPTHAESKLVDVLRANGKAIISLVAELNSRIVGHILFSPVTTAPPGEAKGIGLAPVAVHPGVQSRGIGSKLIGTGLNLCKKLGFDYCVVLGDPKYYQRFGFETASHFGIRNEYGVDHEFMVIHFSERQVSGLAQYEPEFGMFSV